jgi:hypothetical protein
MTKAWPTNYFPRQATGLNISCCFIVPPTILSEICGEPSIGYSSGQPQYGILWHPWAESKGTLPKVTRQGSHANWPKPQHSPVWTIAVWWWVLSFSGRLGIHCMLIIESLFTCVGSYSRSRIDTDRTLDTTQLHLKSHGLGLNWVPGAGLEPTSLWASGFTVMCSDHQAMENSLYHILCQQWQEDYQQGFVSDSFLALNYFSCLE